MGVNVSAQEQIYNELVEARRFPDGLFIASPETLGMLRDMIENKEPEGEAKK